MSDKRKRTKTLLIKMNDEEKQIIIENAQVRGMATSTYMRETAVAGKPVLSKKRNMDTHAVVVELGRIGSNINQMAKVANTMGLIEKEPLTAALDELRQAIRNIR
ncbi:MAG: plasmid mobilization protein [Alphaproteobacteria bacterium]